MHEEPNYTTARKSGHLLIIQYSLAASDQYRSFRYIYIIYPVGTHITLCKKYSTLTTVQNTVVHCKTVHTNTSFPVQFDFMLLFKYLQMYFEILFLSVFSVSTILSSASFILFFSVINFKSLRFLFVSFCCCFYCDVC